MPSNSFTEKAKVLKRPTVCKNRRNEICGTCLGQFEENVHTSPGVPFSIEFILECDPVPWDTTFAILPDAPFRIFDQPTTLKVNEQVDLNLITDAEPGPYDLRITFLNSNKCEYLASVVVVVDPL